MKIYTKKNCFSINIFQVFIQPKIEFERRKNIKIYINIDFETAILYILLGNTYLYMTPSKMSPYY